MPHLFFSPRGTNKLYFFNINKTLKITHSIFCYSKNLIYLIECRKCHLPYIGETKHRLNECFGKHQRSLLNHQQLSTTTPVSLHFNQVSHPINNVSLIPIELIHSKHDPVRKAQEAQLINKAKTLHPFGRDRWDEAHHWHIWHLFTPQADHSMCSWFNIENVWELWIKLWKLHI